MSVTSYVTPPPAGQSFKPSSHFGALVHIAVREFKPDQITQFGTRSGIRADVTVIDFPAGDVEKVGETHRDVMLWGTVLVDQLYGIVGKSTLGRLVPLQGRNANPAVMLQEPSDADRQMADRFLLAHPHVATGTHPGIHAQQPQPTAPAAQQQYQHPPAGGAWPGTPPPPPAASQQQPPF